MDATLVPGEVRQDRQSRRRAVQLAQSYLALTKPRITALITFTALVGTFLASPSIPPESALLWGTLGIALSCACAATLNQVFDSRIDAAMSRTRGRPLPRGQVSHGNALLFAALLGVTGLAVLTLRVNVLTAILTFASLIGYGVVYTIWLKRTTSQNIVIGGLAGAAPPVLGWAAATGDIAPQALLLSLIIFVWTPPHFWSLAIARREEYAHAGIPMLPVTFGVDYTRRQILLYTILLVLATVMPFLIHMSGIIYLVGALALDAMFISYALRLNLPNGEALAMRVFKFSVKYLMWLFAALLTDHYLILLK
ncbi:MAG TPA: heme o synthase [Steroidobacteraceae bacterium]|nr:heme o synthase [Steroidobacteraceae bacterium]